MSPKLIFIEIQDAARMAASEPNEDKTWRLLDENYLNEAFSIIILCLECPPNNFH